MEAADVIVVIRDLLTTAVLLAAPPVVTSLLVGVLVSILQTVTSIQEQTLSFVPRILAVSAVLIVTLPWSIKVLTDFSLRMMVEHLAGAVN